MYYDSILDFNDAGGGDINCILVDVEVNTDSTTANTNRSITSSTVESKQYYSLSIYFVAGRKERRRVSYKGADKLTTPVFQSQADRPHI